MENNTDKNINNKTNKNLSLFDLNKKRRQRVDKRLFLKDFLPADLQITLDDKNKKWYFGEKRKLLSILKSKENGDKIFKKVLEEYNKKEKENIEIEKDVFFDLNKENIENRKEVGEFLKRKLELEKGLKELANKGGWDNYSYLLKTGLELKILTEEEIQKRKPELEKGLKESANKVGWDNYSSLLKTGLELKILTEEEIQERKPELEKGLRELANLGWWNEYFSLLKTGLELKILTQEEIQERKPELEKRLRELANNGGWDNYSSLLKTGLELKILGKPELEKVLRELANNGGWDNYSSLLKTGLELKILTQEEIQERKPELEKGLRELVNKGGYPYLSLLKTGLELKILGKPELEKGLRELVNKGGWDNYFSLLKSGLELKILTQEEIQQRKPELEKGLKELANKGGWDNYSPYSPNGGWNNYFSLLKTGLELKILTEEEIQQRKPELEKLRELANLGWWYYYSSLLKSGLELKIWGKPELEKGLTELANEGGWDNYSSLLKTGLELGIIKLNKDEKLEEYIKSQNENQREFISKYIQNKLLNGESLFEVEKIKLEYEAINKYLIEENDNMEMESKKIKDVSIWIQENSKSLANLMYISPSLTKGLIKENISEGGILRLNGSLLIFKKIEDDNTILDYIKEKSENKLFTIPNDFFKFISIIQAYHKSNKIDLLKEIINNNLNKSYNEIHNLLSHKLLTIIAKSVGVEEKDIKIKLEDFDLQFAPNLSSNQEMIQNLKNNENSLALYQSLMKVTFSDTFQDFINNPNQKDEVGQDIAKHNQKTKELFTKLGIDFTKWDNYHKVENTFSVDRKIQLDAKKENTKILIERANKILELIKPLKDKITPREYEPLLHILSSEKEKSSIIKQNDKNKIQELYNTLKDRLDKIKTNHPNALDYHTLYEHIGHLGETVEAIQSEDKFINSTKSQNFKIKVWDRDPKKDLFQGNNTQCCIAVGVKSINNEEGNNLTTHDPTTVMQYLVDKGMQVIEIIDEETGRPILNTWVFISKNNFGEPIMVLDNIEMNSKYTNDQNVKNELKKSLINYTTKMAKDLNLVAVGVGDVETNDISVKDLPTLSVPSVNKVDGYLKKYTADIGDRNGRYYLEAFNHTNLREVYKGDGKENPKTYSENNIEQLHNSGYMIIMNNNGNTESIPLTREFINDLQRGRREDVFNKNNLQELGEVENGAFPDFSAGTEHIIKSLTNLKGVQILAKDNGKLTGYMSSFPANELYYMNHESLDKSEGTLYIDSIAGSIPSYNKLLKELKEKAKKAGYTKISMHGINKKLNFILEKRFGFRIIEKGINYLGKDSDYMEMDIE